MLQPVVMAATPNAVAESDLYLDFSGLHGTGQLSDIDVVIKEEDGEAAEGSPQSKRARLAPECEDLDEKALVVPAHKMLLCNVLKPVLQHPLEPELDFKRGLWNRYFPGGHAMSMRSIDPGRRRGSRGEEQPPWWGLGRSPRSQR